MRLEVDAFLFDLDGTLINSLAAVERVWHAWAVEQGLDPREVVEACHGRRSLDTIVKFAPHLPQPQTNAEFVEREVRDTDGIFALPGAVDFLRDLPQECWAIVTSCTLKLARARMSATGIPSPQVLITADDVVQGKPAPEGFLLAARRLGVEAERCLVFEDAPAGLEAGRRAGMRVVTVTATHRRAPKVEAAIASAGPAILDYRGVRLSKGSSFSLEI